MNNVIFAEADFGMFVMTILGLAFWIFVIRAIWKGAKKLPAPVKDAMISVGATVIKNRVRRW
jgi:hypothetical protein